MNAKLNQPRINVYQTPKGLLIKGNLPQVENLQTEINEHEIHIQGDHPSGALYEKIPLEQAIEREHTITTFHDNQLRMVVPWRQEQ